MYGDIHMDVDVALTRCGSPLAYIQDVLYAEHDMPDGAVPHLLSASEDSKEALK